MNAPPTVLADEVVLQDYEALEAASVEMLAAARAGDWDRVTAIEEAAGRLIDRLRAARTPQSAQAREQSRRRMRILRRIVLNDAELRYLSQPWLRNLQALLGAPAPLSERGVQERDPRLQ